MDVVVHSYRAAYLIIILAFTFLAVPYFQKKKLLIINSFLYLSCIILLKLLYIVFILAGPQPFSRDRNVSFSHIRLVEIPVL